jgi:signal transduction histidine kinase
MSGKSMLELKTVLEDKELIKRLRKVTTNSKMANKWLHKLDNNQLCEVYTDLRNGFNFSEVIDKVQLEWKIFFEMDSRLLMSDLANFKIKALDDLALLEAKFHNNEPMAKREMARLDGLSKKIDALGRLGWLADVQTDRVRNMVDTEQQENSPRSITGEAIRQLGTLLEKYIKLESETGATRITVTATTPQMQEAFLSTIEGDGNKMINATRRLMTMAEDRSISIKEQEVDIELPLQQQQEVLIDE